MAKVNYLYLLHKYKFHSDAVEVQLVSLTNELSKSNRHINELDQQNSKLQMELLTKEKYISLADDQLLSVKQTVAGQNSSIHALTAECRDHKRLQVIVNEQNALISRLKEELSIFTCNQKPLEKIDVLLKNNQVMDETLLQKNFELAKLQLKDKDVEIERLKTNNAKLTESNETYIQKLSELKFDGRRKKKKNHTSNFFLLDDDVSQKSSDLIMDFSYDHASGGDGEATLFDEVSKLQDTDVPDEVSLTNMVVLETQNKLMRNKASGEAITSVIYPKNRVGMASKACKESKVLHKSISYVKPNSQISKIPRQTPIVRDYLITKLTKDVPAASFKESQSLPANRTLKSAVNHRISILKSKLPSK